MMLITRTLFLSLLFSSNSAFSPVNSPLTFSTAVTESNASKETTGPSPQADIITKEEHQSNPPVAKAAAAAAVDSPPQKKKVNKNAEGLFAPAILLTKDIVGETKLNKLRAKIIGIHADVIGKFTSTSQTEFGNQILKVLFEIADKNGDGSIDEEELKIALDSLGFDFLKEKQIAGIFKRADTDKNGTLDFEEWEKEAPKLLKTNLTKLAKKNGHDLGFLA